MEAKNLIVTNEGFWGHRREACENSGSSLCGCFPQECARPRRIAREGERLWTDTGVDLKMKKLIILPALLINSFSAMGADISMGQITFIKAIR